MPLARRALLATPALSAALSPARAQSRPIRFIVPFVAGGSTDVASRLIAERMSEILGQPVIVENRGGSGGNIGGEMVARAVPDGQTILMGVTGLLSTNAHIYRNMGFDPARELAPVSLAYTSDMVIVVHPAVARDLAGFIARAKAAPGAMSFGSSGHGASTHTAAELFKLAAGIDVVHVPYRGSGAAMNDLIAGNIQMMLVQIAATVGAIRDGRIRALAATGPARHAPQPAVLRLNAAVREALATPLVSSRMAAAGVDGQSSSIEELAAFIRAESDKWGRVVREARITVD
ncbi:MAG: tripartite tricarboxylate transporter substrate binding protein [Alphaproteobacteria bacterium]|nr:tripartite tricarboxylate transporter substrate binding protein [Alphaproteobacteria bacterium]